MHVVFPHSVELIFVSHRLVEIEEVFMQEFDWLAIHVSQDLHCHSICVKDSQVLALIFLHHIFLIVVSSYVDVASKYQHLT
jgi:hypothetical protein